MVGRTTPVEVIVTRATIHVIPASPGLQPVITGSTVKFVFGAVAVDLVMAAVAVKYIVGKIPFDSIVTAPTVFDRRYCFSDFFYNATHLKNPFGITS